MDSTESDRYRRAKEIAFTALDLAPAQRGELIDLSCADDTALRREVQWLIAAAEDDAASDRLPGSPYGLARQAVAAVCLEAPLPRNYRLLRRLDEGGMGVVYLAERVDGDLRQRVALKLLHLGLDPDGSVARRFAHERRILGSLNHPNVAHLVDGGVTSDGQPFLAMEYVEGERIDRWCDRHDLPLRERIELFLKVCQAVDYAHRHLVIHRDIKPANILVTPEGEPKLLDFGIARLLEEDADVTRTQTSLQALTPAYASPEQLEGHALSTATDVYSLGVVLYELVAGTRPFDHLASAHELSNAIVAGQIPPPSKQSRRSESATAEPSPPGRGERRAPRYRQLPADVDAITLKALRRDPAQRYESVAALAADLRSYLASRPVAARRGRWLYRTRRFAQRRRGALAAGLISTLLLAGFMLNREAQIERIARERDRAEAEAAKARQVGDFLTGLFRSSDPRQARGADLSARELLDRGVAQVDRELVTQPEIRADMLQILGRTYSELGAYDAAAQLLTRALSLRREYLGADHAKVGEVVGDLGVLRFRQGRYLPARDQLERAVRIFERSGDADAPELATALRTLGSTYMGLGAYGKSQTALERALAIQARASGDESEAVARNLNDLANLLTETGSLKRAETLYERALAIHERELGPDHPWVGITLMNLASVRMHQGNLTGVEAMYRRALAIQENAYGPVHASVGQVLNNLGHFLAVSGRAEAAIDVLRRTVSVQSSALGPGHPDVGYSLTSLADAYRAAERSGEARDFYRRGATLRHAALGGRAFDPLLAYSLVRLGEAETRLGNLNAAERAMEKALSLWRRAPEAVNPQFLLALYDLGRWLVDQRRCADATPVLQRALRFERTRQRPSGSRIGALERLSERCDAMQSAPGLAGLDADAASGQGAPRGGIGR